MTTTRTSLRFLGLALATASLATSANSVEIIGNLPGNDGTSTYLNAPSGGANGGGVHDSKAAGFTMPGTAYTLDSVTFRLNFFDTASVPVIQIYSNSGTNPGSLLQTLTNPTLSVGTGNFVFTSPSALTLAAGTTYWVVVWNNATGLNSFQWMASSPNQTPTGIATTAGYRFSNGGPPPTGSSSTFNSYAVNATPVPEPATVAILGLGAFALRRRRR